MEIEWAQLFGGGIGGLVGGTIAGFIARSFLGSYLAEKAKVFARSDEIGLLRKEVQVLTKEAETIKATISYGVWDKQRRWEATRNTYKELSVCIREIESSLVRQLTFHHAFTIFASSAENYEKVMADFRKELTQREEAKRILRAATAFAPIDICTDAVALLSELESQLGITDRPSNLGDAEVEALRHTLQNLREKLIGFARLECGVATDHT